jgi:hypothetical protein
LGGTYLVLLGLSGAVLANTFTLRRNGRGTGTAIVSDWKAGKRVARRLVEGASLSQLPLALPSPDVSRTLDDIIDEGPVLGRSRLLFGASFAPAKDGLKATYRGKTAVLTPDDLRVLHAYDVKFQESGLQLQLGVDRDIAVAALAEQFQVSSVELLAHGQFTRLAVRQRVPLPRPVPDVTAAELERAIIAAGRYLARQLRIDGTYRYEVNPFTDETSPGYSWPRHAGATFFLAQVAAHTKDPVLGKMARRAAAHLTGPVYRHCAERRCVGAGNRVDIGSSALTLLALVELVESGIGPEFQTAVAELADFIRSQQRPDGEFKHTFDIPTRRAIDVQLPYFTGEAAFALSRAHRITRDPRDLDGARRAVAYLVYRPSWALGMRYIWTSEHWTCQAMADLWQRAPNSAALEFCMAWHEYGRAITSDDQVYGGVVGPLPYQAVRYTSSASHMEAATATLGAARQAKLAQSRLDELEAGIRRTLRLLLQPQFLPGPSHLMKRPQRVYEGGMPAGSVDYHVRIDYPQHAGAAMLRYLRLLGETGAQHHKEP